MVLIISQIKIFTISANRKLPWTKIFKTVDMKMLDLYSARQLSLSSSTSSYGITTMLVYHTSRAHITIRLSYLNLDLVAL